MIPLPERPVSLWGTDHQVIPYLIEAIHGDGKQWLWFGYMEDRPWFYVVRVDSSVRSQNNNDKWCYEVLAWIYEQIEDEGTYFLTDEQHDEWRNKGYVEGDTLWPIPPLDMPRGSEWGEYEPDENDLAAAGAANPTSVE